MAEALVTPRYGDRSLADLVPSMLASLGVAGLPDALRTDRAQRACLLLVDGLGAVQLAAHADDAPFLAGLAARHEPLTTGTPATTSVSLASLGTGLPPASHGLLGTATLVPGTGVMNTLRWSVAVEGQARSARDAVPPESVGPSPTPYERASAAGVTVTHVGPASLAATDLTRAAFRGATYRDADSLEGLVDGAFAALRSAPRTMVHAYHPGLDLTGHVHGPDGGEWREHLRAVDAAAQRLAGGLPAGTLLVVTGDHGMVTVPAERRVDLAHRPDLGAGVVAVSGDPRLRHLHCADGAAADVAARWEGLLGDDVLVVSGADAVAAGWFGAPLRDDVRGRVGDLVVASLGDVAVVDARVDGGLALLTGQHGAPTATEALVPLALLRA